MMLLTHFKCYPMCGFGVALKNLAMGCASSEGKIEQHECSKPSINKDCILWGTCTKIYPLKAITL